MNTASDRQYQRDVVALGLHPAGAPLPQSFPTKLKFSSMVLKLCSILRDYMSDVVGILRGAMPEDAMVRACCILASG